MKHKKQVKRDIYGPDEEAAAALEAAGAIEFIEKHLFENLTVTRIAQGCSASIFHFSRRFSRRQGESVMSYVRGRRLDIAAKRLASEPHTAVVDLAFDSGFESQAAFTRAFTRAFGMSPDKYRRSGSLRGRKRRNAMTPPPVLRESFEFVDAFQVAGLTGKYDASNFIRINELWKAFVPKGAFDGRLGDGETCGVFRAREFTIPSFEHLAGARISAGMKPEGLEVWTLLGRNYLVFKQMLAEGELHPQVAAAQAEIWSKRIPQSGRTLARAPDFQIYPANFKVGVGGWLTYYIPVE
jgi:AraC family transcriptional regulator